MSPEMTSHASFFSDDASRVWLPKRDHRTEGWLLTGNPLPLLVITAAYMFFVKVAGPRWMSRRKPFELKACILVYNLSATLLSAFFVCRFVKLAYWDLGYTFLQDLDMTDSPANLQIVHLSWWFYMFKVFELADTVFFVLRKKNHQVSALHVVHHVTVPWNMWLNVAYGGQSHEMFIMCLNAFVHVFMYAYYFLAALGPAYRHLLWWKKYMTMMQILQFVLMLAQSIGMVFADGNYVGLFVWTLVAHAILFFVWFTVFYIQSYSRKKL
ncbi:very long chain fatty acid elongase 7-like [Dermacentor albipictus]|uniref:very long chain fatty acid elongase 7-like n=1 Tax=Dermacentor albipictus TaxID=60249 RepID=UPI0038FCB1C2